MTPLLADVGDRVTDGSLLVAVPIALAAGLVSFASPCVLPLVPGYLSYVTGLTGQELAEAPEDGHHSGTVLMGALGFVAGFSVVFVSFGAIFGGLGQLLREHADTLTRLFGIVTVLLGLFFMGLIGQRSWLQRDVRVHRLPGDGRWAGPLLGAAFAFGWTPCIGPTLAAVLNLAATSSNATAGRGAFLSLWYCVGLGIPFVAFGLLFRRAAGASATLRRHAGAISVVGGALLVAVGLAQLTGAWGWLVEGIQSRVDPSGLPL